MSVTTYLEAVRGLPSGTIETLEAEPLESHDLFDLCLELGKRTTLPKGVSFGWLLRFDPGSGTDDWTDEELTEELDRDPRPDELSSPEEVKAALLWVESECRSTDAPELASMWRSRYPGKPFDRAQAAAYFCGDLPLWVALCERAIASNASVIVRVA